MGGPWCCWPLLCVLSFVVIASVGVTLIQTLDGCSSDPGSGTVRTVDLIAGVDQHSERNGSGPS